MGRTRTECSTSGSIVRWFRRAASPEQRHHAWVPPLAIGSVVRLEACLASVNDPDALLRQRSSTAWSTSSCWCGWRRFRRVLSLLDHGLICRRHADAKRRRVGGRFDDRRESWPRLFKVVDATGTSNDTKRRNRPKPAAVAGVVDLQPQLVFDDVEPHLVAADQAITVGEIHPVGEHDPEETQALPRCPAFDQDDDLGGLLTAKGPLLSRAFRSRQESTLREIADHEQCSAIHAGAWSRRFVTRSSKRPRRSRRRSIRFTTRS